MDLSFCPSLHSPACWDMRVVSLTLLPTFRWLLEVTLKSQEGQNLCYYAINPVGLIASITPNLGVCEVYNQQANTNSITSIELKPYNSMLVMERSSQESSGICLINSVTQLAQEPASYSLVTWPHSQVSFIFTYHYFLLDFQSFRLISQFGFLSVSCGINSISNILFLFSNNIFWYHLHIIFPIFIGLSSLLNLLTLIPSSVCWIGKCVMKFRCEFPINFPFQLLIKSHLYSYPCPLHINSY